MNTLLRTLPCAARVTERLMAQFGAERIWQVQQLSDHIYRVLLNDGSAVSAIVKDNGEICVMELEAVW